MSIQKAHELLGHGDENTTRQSAKSLGWRITRGSLKPCVSCAVAKAKAKNTSKKSDSPKPTTPCELVHMDISIVTVPRNDGSEFIIGKKNWTIRVDAATGKKWSDFTATKSEFVERAAEWMNQMKQRGRPILRILLIRPAKTESLRQEFKKLTGRVSNQWSLSSLLAIHRNTTVLLRLHFHILQAKLDR